MNENETIDYLTDVTADNLNDMDQHLAVITTAIGYGYYPDVWQFEAYETATMAVENTSTSILTDSYSGDLTIDVADIARQATSYLNTNGIVPRSYEHGEHDRDEGYGLDTRRDGARLYGAAWVAAI